MAIAPFKYTDEPDEQWDAITKHLRAGDDEAAVRKTLEAAGLRYRLLAADEARDRPLLEKEGRKLVKAGEHYLKRLESIPASEIGVIRRSKVAQLIAWIKADEDRLLARRSNADKPGKRYVVEQVLHVWRDMLHRPIPKSGGNPTGPVASFLIDAANPIIEPDEITGDDARYLIREVEKRRA